MNDNYAKGAADAAADVPHNKLASRALGSLAKNAFGLIPGSGNRMDEYRDGYTETHRSMSQDLHRVRQVALNSDPSATASSAISTPPTGDATMPPSQSSGYSQTVQSAVHNSLSSGAAGGGTSASAQIAMLEDLRAYLGMFQERLIGFSENYQRKVDALDGSLLSEVHRRFVEEELEPARIIMANLGDLILDSSIPAVNRRIEQLEPLAQ